MTKTIKTISHATVAMVAAAAVLLTSTAFAAPDPEGMPEKALSVIPENAIEKAPGLYALGETYDVDSDSMVEGYMIVHPRTAHAKPSGKGKPGGDTSSGSPTASCYGFISNGAKWKTYENWEVDPTNLDGLDHQAILSILGNGIEKWEDAADGKLDGKLAAIMGSGSINTSGNVIADTASTDGRNEVQFAPLADSNTIAVTIVWGHFGGAPRWRDIVEWDQVFNTNYAWDISASGTPNTMDFENIATHELGHAMGLADLYDSSCSAMTMYGYGDYAETKARTLEDGDINGMSALYR